MVFDGDYLISGGFWIFVKPFEAQIPLFTGVFLAQSTA